MQDFFFIDRVGPHDKRGSTNKLQHFVTKTNKKQGDTGHVTHNAWQVTWDT